MRRILAAAMACAMTLTVLTSCSKQEAPSQSGSASSGTSSSSSSDVSTPDASQPDTSTEAETETESETESQPETETEQPDASALKLNNTDFTLFKAGATFQLKVAGAEKDAEIVWTSSDEAVATVDEKGVVTYVAAGSAEITAEVGGETLSAVVRCKADESAETIKPETKPEEKPAVKPEEKPAASVDLTAFYNSLEQQMVSSLGEENSPAMMPMDASMLDAFYAGLNELKPKQVVVVGPMISAVVAEFALAEANNAEEAAQIAAIFQARIDAQVARGGWYPATIEGWELNSRVVTHGNYVFMAAIEGVDDYVASFNALFR